MKTDKNVIKQIEAWVSEEGQGPVVIALIQNGIAPAMAEKITAGRYKSEPRPSLCFLLKAALGQRSKAS